MSNAKFKAGDKVRVRKDLEVGKNYKMDFEDRRVCEFAHDMARFRGKKVTIRGYDASLRRYFIEGCRYCWTDEMFEPVNKKIVITTDGKTTLARLYNGKEVIESAEAKLSKNDEFDFMTGAKLAMERLNTAVIKSNDKIKEGDIVKISDTGHLYTTYLAWVEKHTVSIRDRYKYDYDNYPDLKNSFKVIKISPHGGQNDTLAYITDLKTTRCYLIGIRGLKKV